MKNYLLYAYLIGIVCHILFFAVLSFRQFLRDEKAFLAGEVVYLPNGVMVKNIDHLNEFYFEIAPLGGIAMIVWPILDCWILFDKLKRA